MDLYQIQNWGYIWPILWPRALTNQKQATFVLRMTWTTLDLFVANWPLTLLLTWDVSFVFISSVYFVCGKYARFIHLDHDSMTVTWCFNYIKKPYFLFWHYKHLNCFWQWYDTSVSPVTSNKYGICESCLQDDNPFHYEIHVLMVPDHDDPDVKKQFIISFSPKYTTCSPFRWATWPMLAFNKGGGDHFFWRIIGGQMWTVWI